MMMDFGTPDIDKEHAIEMQRLSTNIVTSNLRKQEKKVKVKKKRKNKFIL